MSNSLTVQRIDCLHFAGLNLGIHVPFFKKGFTGRFTQSYIRTSNKLFSYLRLSKLVSISTTRHGQLRWGRSDLFGVSTADQVILYGLKTGWAKTRVHQPSVEDQSDGTPRSYGDRPVHSPNRLACCPRSEMFDDPRLVVISNARFFSTQG